MTSVQKWNLTAALLLLGGLFLTLGSILTGVFNGVWVLAAVMVFTGLHIVLVVEKR